MDENLREISHQKNMTTMRTGMFMMRTGHRVLMRKITGPIESRIAERENMTNLERVPEIENIGEGKWEKRSEGRRFGKSFVSEKENVMQASEISLKTMETGVLETGQEALQNEIGQGHVPDLDHVPDQGQILDQDQGLILDQGHIQDLPEDHLDLQGDLFQDHHAGLIPDLLDDHIQDHPGGQGHAQELQGHTHQGPQDHFGLQFQGQGLLQKCSLQGHQFIQGHLLILCHQHVPGLLLLFRRHCPLPKSPQRSRPFLSSDSRARP